MSPEVRYLEAGDILQSPCHVIVDPVNCVGASGRGLARTIARAYPHVARAHKKLCERHEIMPGEVRLVPVDPTRMVALLATKNHWRHPSEYAWVAAGTTELVDLCRVMRLRSIAFPALGCGLGELEWSTVRPILFETVQRADWLDLVEVYAPHEKKRKGTPGTS